MKTIQVTALLATLASLISATPTPSDTGIDSPLQVRRGVDDALPVSVMTWIGPIFAGDDTNTTLSGTAQTIYEQILALNPNYSVENPPLAAPEPVEAGSLERRATIDCGYGYMVHYPDCDEGLNYLRALGGGAGWCVANANSCSRVSCSWRCGMHLCNTSSSRLQVYCRDVARDVQDIINRCWHIVDNWNYAQGRYTFGDHYTQLQWVNC